MASYARLNPVFTSGWIRSILHAGFLLKSLRKRDEPRMNQTIRLPNSLNLPFMEGLFADYLRDPSSVTAEWRHYFETMENGEHTAAEPRLGSSFRPPGLFNPVGPVRASARQAVVERTMAGMQDRVDQLVRSYR